MGVVENLCHCFVCNEKGDGIKVVETIFSLSTKQAIAKIDEDFRLGLGKPLTEKEKRRYAEQQKARERERQRQEEMANFERECLDTIAEKLRVADDYIMEKSFKGEVGSAEMYHYADTHDFALCEKAKKRKRWLEWLGCVITGDSHYLVEEEYCATYGTDKVGILRKVYKGEIEI